MYTSGVGPQAFAVFDLNAGIWNEAAGGICDAALSAQNCAANVVSNVPCLRSSSSSSVDASFWASVGSSIESAGVTPNCFSGAAIAVWWRTAPGVAGRLAEEAVETDAGDADACSRGFSVC